MLPLNTQTTMLTVAVWFEMSDDEIAGIGDDAASASSAEVVGDGPARRRPREAGRPIARAFLIVASLSGYWQRWPLDGQALPSDGMVGADLHLLVGCVVASCIVQASTSACLDGKHERLRSFAERECRAASLRGYIEYVIQSAVRCEPTPVDISARGNVVAGRVGDLAVEHTIAGEGHLDATAHGTLGAVLRHWAGQGVASVALAPFSPHLSWQVVAGLCTVMHCVAVASRVNRKRLLIRAEPRSRLIDDSLMGAPWRPHAARRALQCIDHSSSWMGLIDPALVLDWLRASAFVKDVRKMGPAAAAFSTIFANGLGVDARDLLDLAPKCCPELIRLARVRLDLVAMLLSRKMLQTMFDTCPNMNIYLFADASPQWRGLEMFAASMDIQDGQAILRRLLPVLSLDRVQLDALGKVMALLWQVFLVCGPSYKVLKTFLRRVRAVVTDMGTERKMANFADCLPRFYSALDMGFSPPPSDGDLLPRALQIPGWKHLWDVVIRRALSSLSYFPSWIDKLKALISFLRQTTILDEIVRDLRRRGLEALASVLASGKYTTFANWRWGTLHRCCSVVGGFLDSLREHFDPSPWRNLRDRSRLNKVLGALTCPMWKCQFIFVSWLMRWLGTIQSWGGGCSCHSFGEDKPGDDDDDDGASCPRKGRRLKEAFKFATDQLRIGLDEANLWGPDFFGGHPALWQEHQGCVRAVFRLASDKIHFLDRIPWLLVNLDVPGVRDRCVQQYESAPKASHHKVFTWLQIAPTH